MPKVDVNAVRGYDARVLVEKILLLDTAGAENLLEQGDMLVREIHPDGLERMQGYCLEEGEEQGQLL